jgi:hypothetical protein
MGLAGFFVCLAGVHADAQNVSIHVDARQPGHSISRYLTGACIEDVNHEIYGGLYSQMIFGESFQEPPQKAASGVRVAVSGMWRPFRTGSAVLTAEIEKDKPFIGIQSQRVTFVGGEGEVGIENQGLNRWGLNFVAGQPYEGYVWLRAEKPTEVDVALENRDGSRTDAATHIRTTAGT